jgi:hypothetical protein
MPGQAAEAALLVWLGEHERSHACAQICPPGQKTARVELLFGYQKWFEYEAQGLIPFISNGPLTFWMYPVFGLHGASYFLGGFGVADRGAPDLGVLESQAGRGESVTFRGRAARVAGGGRPPRPGRGRGGSQVGTILATRIRLWPHQSSSSPG